MAERRSCTTSGINLPIRLRSGELSYDFVSALEEKHELCRKCVSRGDDGGSGYLTCGNPNVLENSQYGIVSNSPCDKFQLPENERLRTENKALRDALRAFVDIHMSKYEGYLVVAQVDSDWHAAKATAEALLKGSRLITLERTTVMRCGMCGRCIPWEDETNMPPSWTHSEDYEVLCAVCSEASDEKGSE